MLIMNIYCDLSHHLMARAYFLLHYLTFFIIILEIEECVSAILLQLILFPFSPVAILVSPNVYTSIIIPLLPLSIVSPLFPYLY
jgi:hypothetical protein